MFSHCRDFINNIYNSSSRGKCDVIYEFHEWMKTRVSPRECILCVCGNRTVKTKNARARSEKKMSNKSSRERGGDALTKPCRAEYYIRDDEKITQNKICRSLRNLNVVAFFFFHRRLRLSQKLRKSVARRVLTSCRKEKNTERENYTS